MNKNLYRIVFNQSRGQLMAVAETAGAQGKSASGETTSSGSVSRLGKASTGAYTTKAPLLSALSSCMALSFGILLTAPAQAQIKADASAPKVQQPVILQTASGVTQVNITTPSAAGVSRNTYSQFDVQQRGVILNNANANVLTQLGGFAQGNPLLTAGSARVILNEVNSANPSNIYGYVEVAGQRAEVIIANPSGINVNGGGFINASRATLTTGTPIMNGGSLDGYLVQRGMVNITGAGLDASTTDYTGIIARAVQVNAGIWAKDLKVIAGANQVDAAQTTATPITGTGPAPGFAIDVAQLGGMYAGKIMLVGTEAGLGVRNAGVIGATAGDVVVQSNGWLTNSGTVYAAGNTSLSTQGNMTNTATGLIAAQGNTTLTATGPGAQISTAAGSVIAAGLNADGSLRSMGDVSITSSTTAQLKGQLTAGAGMALSATSLDLSDVTLSAQTTSLTATTADVDLSRSTLSISGQLTASAAQTLRTDGAAVTANQLTISANDVSNIAGQIIQTGTGNTRISLAGNLDNTRGRIATNSADLTLAAQTLTNTDGKVEHAGTGALSVTANTFNGQRGQVSSNGALVMNGGAMNLDNASMAAQQITINAASISNRAGTITQTGTGATRINTTGAVDNTGGNITSNGATAVSAQSLANQGGTLQATGTNSLAITTTGALDNSAAGRIKGGDLSLMADSLNNSAGFASAAGTLTATTAQAINNTDGQLLANGHLQLTAGSINNTRGAASSTQGNLHVTTTYQVTNTAGTLQAAQDIGLNAAALTGDGRALAGRDAAIALTRDFTNSASSSAAGQVLANGNLTFSTTGSITNNGTLQSGNALTLAAANLTNNAAGQLSANQTRISATGTLVNRGLIDGVQTRVNASTLYNLGTGRIYGDNLGLTANNLINDAETAGGVATAAVIAARTRLDVGVGNLSNSNGATLLSVGDAFIGGALNATGQAIGRAGTISNTGATIQALGNLSITADTLSNTNAGFNYVLQTVAGPSETVYSTAGGTYYATQGAVADNGPLQYFLTDSLGYNTFSLGSLAAIPYRSGFRYLPRQGTVAGNTVYGVVEYASTTQQAIVTSSNPGWLTSGGAMVLDVSSQINNDMSQIVAGTTLSVTGSASINNAQINVPVTNIQTGYTYTWANYDSGGCGGGGCNRWTAYGQYGYYNAVASTTTLQGSYQGYAATPGQSAATPGSTGFAGGPAAQPLISSTPSTSRPGTQVRTSPAAQASLTGLANSALFRLNPSPTATYLVQTDPRFTNLRQWLSSDYMLTALGTDPGTILKRLGDGFYEQRLINEQVAQLTGRRFLANYSNAEQEYQGLMDAGITVARQFNLQPGIALSAAQMAQLTSDIVWLVEQTVTLPDGRQTRALVPQLYVANIRPGDMDGTGALLSAQAVNINITGDVNNSGTIGGNVSGTVNGRTLVNINAANINNLFGSIQGEQVSLNATNDISNTGGTLAAASALTVNAGRDINLTSTTASNNGNSSPFTRTQLDRLAGVYVAGLNGAAGSLSLLAGRDINAQAAAIANTSNGGATTVQANRDINLSTVRTDFAASVGGGNDFFKMQTSQDVGSSITSNGNLTVAAGNNINAVAANLQSNQGNTALTAGNSINLTAGQRTSDMAWGSQSTSSGFLSSSSTVRRETGSSTQAVGTTVGGNNVSINAATDINIKGSSVIADRAATLTAGNNVNIEAAVNTSSQSSFTETRESGFLSGGGFGVTFGSRQQSADQRNQTTTAAASTVGSIAGNVNINAGQAFRQVGSGIVAPAGDINITARKVDIVEARETSQTTTENRFKQSGISVGISSPISSAIQQVQNMAQAASNTSDGRMKALAGAATAFNLYNNATNIGDAAKALASGDIGKAASINVSIGSSQSQSNSSSSSDTARGSTVIAGNNVNITATGAGQDSNLLVQGSTVRAGGNTNLAADNNINLLAARNDSSQTSTNSSSSSSVGASYGAGGFGFSVSASRGQGSGNGQDTSLTNSQVQAGNTATIQSGQDTALRGAVVSANQVIANVGGSLAVQSLQDTSTFTGQQSSAGASVSFGGGGITGGSVSASRSNIDSNFQSVNQQSGIKAGDAGFQVSVANNTTLVGGVIASTQSAVDNNKNSFSTGGTLTTSDIQNSASFKGTAVGVSIDAGTQAGKFGVSGVGAGLGSDKGSADSTTSAGISGIAGNTAVRTGDAETGLQKIFDAAKVQRDIDAQVAITQAFTKEAPKAVAKFSADQGDDLKAQAKAETDPAKKQAMLDEATKWGEGGRYRVLLHALTGALGGGVTGAAGATASASAAPLLNDLQDGIANALQGAGLGADTAKGIAQGITGLTAAGVGAAVGGGQGAISGLTVDANNRQLHPREIQRIRDIAQNDSAKEQRLTDAACAMAKCSAEFASGSQEYIAARNSEIRGQGNTYELKQLADINKVSPDLFGNSWRDTAIDGAKNIVNTAAVAGGKAVDFALGAAKGGANVVVQAGATAIDAVQLVGAGVYSGTSGQSTVIAPISDVGKAIAKDGLIETATTIPGNAIRSVSDAGRAAGQGDFAPAGEIVGALAVPVLVNKAVGAVLREAIPGESVGPTAAADNTLPIPCTTACFVAGTLIETSQGLKAIETFLGGELVLSRHEYTQEQGYRPVTSTKATHNQELFEVVVEDEQGQKETLHTTSEHPFWVPDIGWVKAAALLAGMQLLGRRKRLHVQSKTALTETASVYNIQVEEHHTYHVGEFGVWVHNANCCDVVTQNSITPSLSGNLSKTKLGNEAITLDTPKLMQPAARDIQINGDITGGKTENLVNATLKADTKVTVLEGTKYNGNNGLDHVVQFVDTQTNKLMTMVIDSKQLAKSGSTSLDPKAAGGVMQLSDDSLAVVMNRLPDSSPAKLAIEQAQKSGTLLKAVAYVDKTEGQLKIVPVNVPNPVK